LLKAFEGTVEDHTLSDVRLIISELVTNAVCHANSAEDSRIGVDVAVSRGLIRGEVSDAGAGFSSPLLPEPPPPGQVAGRGLYMVSRTVDRWGVNREEFFHVWFEIDR
jgi:anti-sigma regulatory factor (Ser/Thr protein kinase)